MKDNILHLPTEDDVTGSVAGGIAREVIDGLTGIRQCTRRSGAIYGGLSRHIATFFYRDVVIKTMIMPSPLPFNAGGSSHPFSSSSVVYRLVRSLSLRNTVLFKNPFV